MVVLVTGDRNWSKPQAVHRELYKRREKLALVVEGGARGADFAAKEAADLLGIQVATFHANWTYHRKAAGPIRNANMIKFVQPDLVLAFHPDLKQSKGTRDMVRQARKAGIRVKVFKK